MVWDCLANFFRHKKLQLLAITSSLAPFITFLSISSKLKGPFFSKVLYSLIIPRFEVSKEMEKNTPFQNPVYITSQSQINDFKLNFIKIQGAVFLRLSNHVNLGSKRPKMDPICKSGPGFVIDDWNLIKKNGPLYF